MQPVVAIRLAVMMFLQFLIWGAWYVTAPRALSLLGFSPEDFGWTYSVGPIAGMISPIFVGLIADRYMPTQVVLGIMHLLGAAAMYGAIVMMGQGASPDTINLLFFLHMLCYFPTLALTNSLAMQNMSDTSKLFPLVRVFGTFGWIAAGFALNALDLANNVGMFELAAGASALLGIYSFTLPHTPPPGKGQKFRIGDALGLDALVLLKRPSYFTFMLSSFLICIPLAFYYQMAERTLIAGGVSDTEVKMTFGQISEIFFMVAMPLFFARLGVKWMLLVGMFAWVVRYALFAIGTPNEVTWMLLSGVILHGICYDFFFVTGQIYTDQAAPPEIRSQAQGMLVLFTLGLGMLIGAQIGGRVESAFTPAESTRLAQQASDLREEAKAEGVTPAEAEAKEAEAVAISRQALAAKNWKMIWALPAIGAAVILALFTVTFKEDPPTAIDPVLVDPVVPAGDSGGQPEPAPA